MNWLYYLFTASLLFSSNQIPGLDQKRPILLKGGTIHTMTGDILEGYDLLFAKGKIISIDEEIQPSPETDVYDVYEKHIVPGYIAAHTRIGLTEISAVKQTNDHSEAGDYNPNTRANVSYNPDSDLITVTRSNGILIANSVPSSGRISGQSSVMLLDGWTWEDATIKHPGGLNLNWPNMRINYNPNAKKKEKEQKEDYKKSIRELDNFIRDVRAYHQRRTVRERRAEDKQLSDLRLESMVHYVIDKNPIHVKANDIRQIEAAINWAKKHNLKIVIVGGRDSWMNTDLLIRENIPVILTTIQTTPRRRHRRREEERKRRSTFLLPCRARNPRSQYSSRVLCEISFFMERKSVNSCAGGLENAVSLQSSGERKPYVFFSAKYVAFTKLPRVLVEPVVEV